MVFLVFPPLDLVQVQDELMVLLGTGALLKKKKNKTEEKEKKGVGVHLKDSLLLIFQLKKKEKMFRSMSSENVFSF